MTQQSELFGYRKLITHVRPRNTIPAAISETMRSHPSQAMKAPDGNHYGPPTPQADAPPPFKSLFKRRERISKAMVEALIERFKPFAARTRERDRKWMR